jgi:Anti-sigma-28 factor, FlgM
LRISLYQIHPEGAISRPENSAEDSRQKMTRYGAALQACLCLFQDHTVCKVSAVPRRKTKQLIFQGSRMVLDICNWIAKSRPDDVRWDKVEHVKRILTGETYPVSPKQIAAKLIEHMLEHGRANQRWRQSESSGETE